MNTPIEIDADNKVWTLHKAGVAAQVIGVSQNGVQHDISENEIYFQTDSGIEIRAVPASDKPGCVEIPFSLSDIDAIPHRGALFHVIDKTDARIYANGKVYTAGFRAP